ncbi:MAG TPA: hypothetical protein VII59_04310 [Streptosporangiaceae bacterium]
MTLHALLARLGVPGGQLSQAADLGDTGTTEGTGDTATALRPAPPAADPGPLRSFDPVEIGRLEAAVWAAYYRRQWLRLLLLSAALVHRAFGMDWPRTVHGSWLVLRANQLWAPYPRNDPDGARRCMRRFYALLRLAHGAPADPARAAVLEVAWWAAHRARQHQPGAAAAPEVAAALARLYAYLYGVDEGIVRPAAEHRAAAMTLSDEWVAQGCPPGSALLTAARAALVRSYAALLAAVHY